MENFLQKFASQFDETAVENFESKTRFRNIPEWSSLIALCIIAMVDEEYQVKLTGDDIRSSDTIEDIYKVVVSKAGNVISVNS